MTEYEWFCEFCEKGIDGNKPHLSLSFSCEGQGGWATYCNRECLEKSINYHNTEGDTE
jgi:hypothetical protein